VTLFEEMIFDADPSEDIHLLLDTPGGDGETAVRLVPRSGPLPRADGDRPEPG
jgi:hypothetical protein